MENQNKLELLDNKPYCKHMIGQYEKYLIQGSGYIKLTQEIAAKEGYIFTDFQITATRNGYRQNRLIAYYLNLAGAELEKLAKLSELSESES